MKNYLLSSILFLGTAAAALAQGQLFTIEENGPRSSQVNIVFMGDAYTSATLPSFAGDVDDLVDSMFQREPWKEYRQYCNLYRIEVASTGNTLPTDEIGTGGDTYFGSYFDGGEVSQLLRMSPSGKILAYDLLNTHVPEYSLPIMVVDSPVYGGSGGEFAVTSQEYRASGVLEHEIGHVFSGLADEYDIEYSAYTPVESPNATEETDPNLIRWKAWIEDSTPLPTPETNQYNDPIVGLFEGANYRISDWYRPHNNSLMKSISGATGSVNTEAFVLSIYDHADLVIGKTPDVGSFSASGFRKLNFEVDVRHPQPPAAPLEINWLVNEVVVKSGSSKVFSITSDCIGNGSHIIAAEVADRSDFVRVGGASVMTARVKWAVDLSGQLPCPLDPWRASFGDDNVDLAGDGLVNLVKYALVLDPKEPVSPRDRPRFKTDGAGRITSFIVPRKTRRDDVEYLIETSRDLKNWDPKGEGIGRIMRDDDSGLEFEFFKEIEPGDVFARLKIIAK